MIDEQEAIVEFNFDIPEPVPVCKCLRDDESSEQIEIQPRKLKILSTVSRTENYLKEHQIPALMRFLLTKLMNQKSETPLSYLEKLLDDCMLYRAGYGSAPVLYEDKHLEAVIKSFDPSNRGWLTIGQVRRAHDILGLTMKEFQTDQIPCHTVMDTLKKSQESELLQLLSAGTMAQEKDHEN